MPADLLLVGAWAAGAALLTMPKGLHACVRLQTFE